MPLLSTWKELDNPETRSGYERSGEYEDEADFFPLKFKKKPLEFKTGYFTRALDVAIIFGRMTNTIYLLYCRMFHLFHFMTNYIS